MSWPGRVGPEALCTAGAIAEIRRVGIAPFETDDVIEIVFASGALFNIDIGLKHATDIEIYQGALLERAYGHLRGGEQDTYDRIARDWSHEPIAEIAWARGHTLSQPRRLIMTQPYRVEVGYAFGCGPRDLAIFGEADLIHIAALDDEEIVDFKLELEP